MTYFATAAEGRTTSVQPGLVSVKGGNWRIFYTLPADGNDPGLAKIIAKPTLVGTVAYVKDASTHVAIVAKARKCGSA